MNTWKEKGRGRKGCPACGIFIPVRSAKCICGHEFVRKAKKPPPPRAPRKKEKVKRPKKKEVEVQYSVWAPRGPCPDTLHSIDPPEVSRWMKSVQSSYDGRLSAHAYEYWAKRFFPEDRKQLQATIVTILCEA